jgi:putative DNA primase/helicase
MTAAEIAARMRLRRVPGRLEWRGTCPACAYGSGVFTLAEGEGRPLWWCASCRDQASVTAAVKRALDGALPPGAASPRREPQALSTAEKSARAHVLWDAARPIQDTPAERYLRRRGAWEALHAFAAHPSGAALRFLPRCRNTETERELPAMLAAARDPTTGALRAVHRTWITPDGRKAALAAPKKSLGPIGGAAILIHAPEPGLPLVAAEGVETALGAVALLGAPGWCAVAAGNMAALRLPDDVRDLILAADPGDAGEAAARQAARRWRIEGRRVRIALPDDPTADFNDLLMRRTAPEAGRAG